MSNTTIDGLKVRTSRERAESQMRGTARVDGAMKAAKPMGAQKKKVTPANVTKKRVPRAVRAEAKAVRASAKRPTRHIDLARRQPARAYTDPLLQRKAKAETEEFLSPVESFARSGAERRGREDFVESNNADWSELLGEISEERNEAEQAPETREMAPSEEFLSAQNSARDFFADEEDDDDTPEWAKEWTESEPVVQPKRKHKKKHHIGRTIAIILVLVLAGGGVGLYFWGDSLISRLTGGQSGLWGTLSAMISEEIPFRADENGRTNVLIFGTEGYNMNGDVGDGQHDGAQLTDSIMVVSFDQKTHDVAMVSLPRDLKVKMACSAGKINEVFWCHNQSGTNETAGAEALMKQVGEIFGLEIQYYAHVNWGSLVSIVDTLGGVTVTLDEDINDVNWTGAVAQAGVPITVNGEQALGLARARHGTAGGDFTRGNTQQKIIMAIVEKMMSNGVGVSEALNFLNILGDNLRTNFSADNVKAGVRMATNFSIAGMRQIPLVDYDNNIFYVMTATINEISYVVPSKGADNYNDIQEYITRMTSSDPLKREGAEVVVLNATEEAGVAGAERKKLEEAGFNVVRVGDAEATACEAKYCVYAINAEMPETQKALSTRYGVEVKGVEQMPEEIYDAKVDFIVVIGAGAIEEAGA